MKQLSTLIKKEFQTLFYSGTGLIVAFIFFATCGSILWLFEGNLNILDNGYASLNKFFSVAPLLLIILIPALTMRLFAEEQKNGTLLLLKTRPVSLTQIWCSKWISTTLFLLLILFLTSVYVVTIYQISIPKGSIDLNTIYISYTSLFIVVSLFVAVGLFASSLTKNSIIAFVLSVSINLISYYGFNLISQLISNGSIRSFVASISLFSHYETMQYGIIAWTDILTFGIYLAFFFVAGLFTLDKQDRGSKQNRVCSAAIIILLIVITPFLKDKRLDFTEDKRFTINEYSQQLLSNIEKRTPIKINIYLNGKLNYGFRHLQEATKQLLVELNQYADNSLEIDFVNPNQLGVSRDQLSAYMEEHKMPGIILNEVDRNGKLSQQIIYPYAQLISGQDTLTTPLLKNIANNSAEENLNASIENLEFQFIDALRLITQKNNTHIAFIEGHGELPRPYVYDAEELLSKYFFVNRGQIGTDISVLDHFKVVIVAGTTQQFSETDKYILDQYIMNGGRVLWLIDGAKISYDHLEQKGQSASMKNETNLDDLLFTYGVRINSDLLQDNQCTSIIVKTGKNDTYTPLPYYYSPLLLPSPNNIVTKDISAIKAEFVSSINVTNQTKNLKKEIILTSSQHTHIIRVPEMIDLDIRKIQSDPDYFQESFLPVAISLEGQFNSVFENRPIPQNIENKKYKTRSKSKQTKMIVVSSSSVIRNNLSSGQEQTQIIPMGFDRVSKKIYGNRDFIVNAVNWLADEDGIMYIRNKTNKMYLLDRKKIADNRTLYTTINIGLPILITCVLSGGIYLRRRKKYSN